MTEILLVILGWMLAFIPNWWRGRRRIATHWAALGVEVEVCRRRAEWYINGTVTSPLYRFPTLSFSSLLPEIFAEKVLATEEIDPLIEFFSWCEDINRGLINADEARKSNNVELLSAESRRIMAKAKELLHGRKGEPILYQETIKIIKKYQRKNVYARRTRVENALYR